MRYFIELSYLGKAYCGWQRQPDMPTVQSALEEALSKLLGQKSEVVGAGRTDTGVHASYYVAHFDTDKPVVDVPQFLYKINRILPRDIAVKGLRRVREGAHARFDAQQREYRYLISPWKNPFTVDLEWQYQVPLDLDKMNQAAMKLLDYEDFTSFAKLNSNNHTNICHLSHAAWERLSDGRLCFTIRSDRFLRNMVRAIVGTLVDVGRGRYTVEAFDEIIRSRDLQRCSAGAPAEGLYLNGVEYAWEIFV